MTNRHLSQFGRTSLFALLLTGGTALAAGCSGTDSAGPSGETENVGSTAKTFEQFEASVYREADTGIYIVDGDIPITSRDALKEYFEKYVRDGALIVNRVNNADDRWNDTQKLDLTYCVSTGFGTNYNAVVAAMEDAASAWSSNTRVAFRHVAGQDGSCTATNDNVLFDVRPVSGQSYLARAFFPSYARANRNVLIDGTAFSSGTYTLTGILRHELGHTLGFRHEHTRPESKTCFEDNNWRPLTAYDAASVMHYPQCNGTNRGDLLLTPKDIEGAVALYGLPAGPRAKSLCRTAPTATSLRVRSDLAAPWNNAGTTSVAVYPSTGSSFNGWYQGLTAGGWSDTDKFAAGDFNKDGLADTATAWNDNGKVTIAVRLSTGRAFTMATWAQTQLPFFESSQLLPGDFNKDGFADLAIAWNDQGKTTVGVLLSNGSSFGAYQAWSTRQGGWSDTDRWTVGDFNNDGSTDLATVWNFNGENAIAIRRSTGSSFVLQDSAIHMGGWLESTKWLAGDFNGDSKTDLAAAWNDSKKAKVAVYLSTGSTFNGWNQWDTSGGGWSDDDNWVAGDFDGDGYSDLATAWKFNNDNVLTVRRSTGTAFKAGEAWLNPAGGWIPSTQWCAGKFAR
ncbi:M57 family metalloprotease [Pendulispora brunnea]|uniref:M57 family metalloprotease n=1 Tax=Pendulispora brunnea TaxID=2905690 RepID=A0ABZ2JZN6_9BACT